MNWSFVRAIARKDLRLAFQNCMAVASMLATPLLFAVIMPASILLLARLPAVAQVKALVIQVHLLEHLPGLLQAELLALPGQQFFAVTMIGYVLAPMFLIMPLIGASSVGAESFAGEKERKTLEAIFYTPATDSELFIGKVLAGAALGIGLALLSFLLYCIVANGLGMPIMGGLWFPLPTWWPLILWVTPAIATFGISVSVIISSRVNTFVAAHQISGLLVLPLLSLVIGQMAGVMYLTTSIVLGAGLVLWIVAGGILWFGVKQFTRSRLMTSL